MGLKKESWKKSKIVEKGRKKSLDKLVTATTLVQMNFKTKIFRPQF